MLMSPEIQARIETLRVKSLAGTITLDEMRESIKLLRENRLSAAQASKPSRAKAPPRSADELLSELDKL